MVRILSTLVVAALWATSCSDDPVATDVDDPTTTALADETTTTTAEVTATDADEPDAPDTDEGFLTEPAPRDCEATALYDGSDPEAAAAAECWWVTVPVQHDDPDGPTYDLAVTRLVSPAAEPDLPVIYLSGGPGWAGGNPATWGRSSLLAERDVYVFDQRGTGNSEPSTECAAMEANVIETFALDRPHEDEAADRAAAVAACHDDLTTRGVDVDSFSTPASAADLDVIRRTLGIEEWHLFGISYGTRLALETMRAHPDGIRSVILDSVYPSTVGAPDRLQRAAERVFTALIDECAATTCAAGAPTLAADLDAAIDRYDNAPYAYTATVDDAATDFVLTGSDLFAGLFNSMYDTDLLPVIPAVIGRFAAGDVSVVVAQTETGIDFLNLASEGMAIATDCADNAAFGTADEWTEVVGRDNRLSTLHLVVPGLACADFPVEPVDPAFNEPVVSDIPALVLAGSLDPITPPADSQATAESLTNAAFVAIDQVAHGVVFGSPCGTELAESWLRDPDPASLDTSCVPQAPRAWEPTEATVDAASTTALEQSAAEPAGCVEADPGAWTDADGCAVAVDLMTARPGSERCSWETVTFLTFGTPLGEPIATGERTYIHDPVNMLTYIDREVRNRILFTADLGAGVVDTGYRLDDAALWADPDDPTFVYLADGPRAKRFHLDDGEPIVCP